MASEIIMPKVDMVMETGTFVEWLKQEGDTVEKGEPLFVINTEKAAIEVDSPDDGILAGLIAKPDDIIPVTEIIGYIVKLGESIPKSKPSNPKETTVEPDRHHHKKEESCDSIPENYYSGSKPRVTPLARRMAEDLGINLFNISGRGPKGRIHKADILDFQESQGNIQHSGTYSGESKPGYPNTTQKSSSAQQPFIIPLPNAKRKDCLPLTGTRKIIADRMVHSAFTAPHINLTMRVDMTEALRFRHYLSNSQEKHEYKGISITSILAYSVTKVLPEHLFVNASFTGNSIILWEDINLGIAMDVDGNLIVPVLGEAQKLSIFELAETLEDLVERARSRRLLPGEMSGSTFTISNLGMFDIESFTAVINPPEAAILAVGKIVDTPVRSNNQIDFKPTMQITVSADHRILDGASVARFMKDIKKTLEDPFLLAKGLGQS